MSDMKVEIERVETIPLGGEEILILTSLVVQLDERLTSLERCVRGLIDASRSAVNQMQEVIKQDIKDVHSSKTRTSKYYSSRVMLGHMKWSYMMGGVKS